MNCLVTGHTGFVGLTIFNFLKGCPGINVDGYTRGDTLMDKSYDFIIHCAAITPSKAKTNYEYINDNIVLTNKILKKFKNSKIIFLSTKDIYGNPTTDIITEETLPFKQSFYGTSKYLAELLIEEAVSHYIILRIPTIIGKLSPSTFITRLVDNILSNKKTELYGGNSRFNSIIHIDELVKIVFFFISNFHLVDKKIINVASSEFILLKDLPAIITDTLGIPPVEIVCKDKYIAGLMSIDKLKTYMDVLSTKQTIVKYINDIRKKV